MRLALCFAVAIGVTSAHPPGGKNHFWTWHPAGPHDVRAPCPMLNSLANHGFLPHNGKDITEEITIDALFSALNINETLSRFLFSEAVTTNPTPNATSFDLDHLSRHNILEHDGSLSRGDYFFGDAHTFNQTIFDQTTSYFTSETVTVQMAANARLARIHTSNATNPTFSLSELGSAFSLGESVAYIMVLGDETTKTVKKSVVEYLFEHERLPVALGWSRRKTVITFEELNDMMDRLVNASTTSPEERKMLKRGAGIHVGPEAPGV